ncbi:hypothetical protein GCM10027046_30440 [Uliginosibacterium flavum]|uniref:DUF805 domain-containing protein n=1 Tax=Uliginosibacterium flavum TaxID=1396831 RepID=A0ABV2TG93_9RHOO
MTEKPMTFRIRFDGETMPGVTRETALQNTIEQLAMAPAQAEALFSGRSFVLKRGLDAEQMSRYMERLVKAGLRIRSEPEFDEPAAMPPAASSAAATLTLAPIAPPAQAPANPPPLTLAASLAIAPPPPEAEEIVCPRCQEKQPKRTLCRSCSADIPRLLVAQQEAETERREEARAAREAAKNPRGQRPRPSHSGNEGDSQPALLGFSFNGRLRRRAFFLAGCLQLIVMIALLNFALRGFSLGTAGALLMISSLLLMYWNLRTAALRCHDIGWSGWLSLLLFVPVANFILTLILLFMPGQEDDNEFGEMPYPTPWLKVIGAVVLLFIGFATTASTLAQKLPEMAMVAKGQNPSGASARQAYSYNSAKNEVVMYSLTTCGYCVEKRQQLNAEGIQFTEVFLDQDQNAANQLHSRLRSTGYNGGIGTPSFEINGEFLLNNPDMSEIHARLRS